MKFTFLGTSSCEGVPALFCNCKNCQRAREIGKSAIRTRSQSIINEDLLLDFPADTNYHFLTNGILGHKIKYLLITHSHEDHFYSGDLSYHAPQNAHNMDSEILTILAARAAYDELCERDKLPNVNLILAKPYEKITLGDYKITPLPAKHQENSGAMIYLIESDKTLLYAHDTGYFYEEVIDYLVKNNIKLDMISYDCAYCEHVVSDDGGHMGIENITRLNKRLRKLGIVTDKTLAFANHFTHNADNSEKKLRELLLGSEIIPANDGMTVNI